MEFRGQFVIKDSLIRPAFPSVSFVSGCVIRNGLIIQNINGKFSLYNLKGENTGIIDIPPNPRGLEFINDTILCAAYLQSGKIIFCNIRNSEIMKILRFSTHNFIILGIDFLDTIGVISGYLESPERKQVYLINTVYLGGDTSRWGQIISCRDTVERDSVFVGTVRCQVSPDARILRMQIWTGQLKEYSISGDLLFSYPIIKGYISCPEHVFSWDSIPNYVRKCDNYEKIYLSGFILMALRNTDSPPVSLDFWDISRRKFIGTADIGSGYAIGFTE